MASELFKQNLINLFNKIEINEDENFITKISKFENCYTTIIDTMSFEKTVHGQRPID